MPNQEPIIKKWSSRLINEFRYRLSHTDALPQLAILGFVSGLATGVIAVLFRLSFEIPLHTLFGKDTTEAFQSLPAYLNFLLPFMGIVFVALILSRVDPTNRLVGVGHVVDRVHQHQSRFPLKNALVQFFCGSLLLSSGTPIGREGPAVHLGAAVSSSLGHAAQLPNNSLRLLAGCGVAAAIGASFNTPLAGVIFAMEVVLMEYTIAGFLPVVLAAVSATAVSHLVYGNVHAFTIPPLHTLSLTEIPYLLFSAVIIGSVAAVALPLFNYCLQLQKKYALLPRALLIAVITAVTCFLLPSVQGIGYALIQEAMLGNIGIALLIVLAIAKLMLACGIVGLGLPGGMVSPILVAGSCLGAALGVLGSTLAPDQAAYTSLYAMLGMGAMMGAMLNAPLAGLLALLELTSNVHILLPAMLVISIATITARMMSKLPGLFLINRNPDRIASPVFQMLSRAGVISLMNKNTLLSHGTVSLSQAQKILEKKLDWVIVGGETSPKGLLNPVDLAIYLKEIDVAAWDEKQLITLWDIPGRKLDLLPISSRATLAEALSLMRKNNISAVYVSHLSSQLPAEIVGIITRDDIDNYYH